LTDEMHPQVAAVLKQAQRLQSLMDDQLTKMNTESFTATETVAGRVNEALQKAALKASASIDADRERIDAVVAEITADLQESG